jgi:hypothetical protein
MERTLGSEQLEVAEKPTFKAVHIESPSSQRLQF